MLTSLFLCVSLSIPGKTGLIAASASRPVTAGVSTVRASTSHKGLTAGKQPAKPISLKGHLTIHATPKLHVPTDKVTVQSILGTYGASY